MHGISRHIILASFKNNKRHRNYDYLSRMLARGADGRDLSLDIAGEPFVAPIIPG